MSRIVNLQDFIAGLEGDAREVERMALAVTKRLALGILRRVVLASPVDTGRFRGNWQIDIGPNPTAAETGKTDTNGATTLSLGSERLAAYAKLDLVNIVNNVPYAAVLNGGSSKQAPAGFVEAAIDAETRFASP